MKKTKLELTWPGKEERPRLEPRILLEHPERGHHAAARREGDLFDNMLIKGDNLLALKALEQDYAGKVKCIFIDPPYNTGQAFEHYDDGLEVSIWLSLMRDRLSLLKSLLTHDGVIFIQIDDNYLFHLKLICDEIFGRSNFVNLISIKTKNSSGASGGGEDRRLKKNTEFLLCYSREGFTSFNAVYSEQRLDALLDDMAAEGKSFKYTSLMREKGVSEYIGSIKDGAGEEIKVFRQVGVDLYSVTRLANEEKISLAEAISRNFNDVFTTENAQTSIRTRVQDFLGDEDGMFKIEYVPKSGRNKGKITEVYFQGAQKRLVSFFSNVADKRGSTVFKKEKVGTLWDKFNWNNVTREGGVRFPNGQKPEELIYHCVALSTSEGDLVLDSFAGSGTTGAVAHKMGRRWIMVEIGNHADTHIVPRLTKAIDGEDLGGVTKAIGWEGGGGFRYYTLAPSLLERDAYDNWVIAPEYNGPMLAQAMCKHLGFTYDPAQSDDSDERHAEWWRHGRSSESDFLYVTTQALTQDALRLLSEEVGPERSLLICARAFSGNIDAFENLTCRKIPASILSKCEWGRDDYSLNVAALPERDAADDAPDAGPLFAREPANG